MTRSLMAQSGSGLGDCDAPDRFFTAAVAAFVHHRKECGRLWREKTGADPLNSKDESTAIDFMQAYWEEIVEKWVTFFVYKKAVSNTKINKKIKKDKVR